MVDKDPVAEAHRRQMEELARFVESKNLTPELAHRLFNHFNFQYQKAVENRASSSVPLPRQVMRARSISESLRAVFEMKANYILGTLLTDYMGLQITGNKAI